MKQKKIRILTPDPKNIGIESFTVNTTEFIQNKIYNDAFVFVITALGQTPEVHCKFVGDCAEKFEIGITFEKLDLHGWKYSGHGSIKIIDNSQEPLEEIFTGDILVYNWNQSKHYHSADQEFKKLIK